MAPLCTFLVNRPAHLCFPWQFCSEFLIPLNLLRPKSTRVHVKGVASFPYHNTVRFWILTYLRQKAMFCLLVFWKLGSLQTVQHGSIGNKFKLSIEHPYKFSGYRTIGHRSLLVYPHWPRFPSLLSHTSPFLIRPFPFRTSLSPVDFYAEQFDNFYISLLGDLKSCWIPSRKFVKDWGSWMA